MSNLTEPFSAQARPKQAMHVTSYVSFIYASQAVVTYDFFIMTDRIAGKFCMVLIFVYFICSIPYTKLKTAKI